MESKRHDRAKSKDITFEALKTYHELENNTKLHRLEANGFTRGFIRGKSMDVPLHELEDSLRKQFRDWAKAAIDGDPDEIMRTLADLRNVAGCVFLKIHELDSQKKLETTKK